MVYRLWKLNAFLGVNISSLSTLWTLHLKKALQVSIVWNDNRFYRTAESILLFGDSSGVNLLIWNVRQNSERGSSIIKTSRMWKKYHKVASRAWLLGSHSSPQISLNYFGGVLYECKSPWGAKNCSEEAIYAH